MFTRGARTGSCGAASARRPSDLKQMVPTKILVYLIAQEISLYEALEMVVCCINVHKPFIEDSPITARNEDRISFLKYLGNFLEILNECFSNNGSS